MTTTPTFPTTHNIRTATADGFADIRRVVNRAESQILNACDELDSELNAWLTWLERQDRLPLDADDRAAVDQTAQIVDDAAAQAQQTNDPARARNILDRLRARLGRAPHPQQPEPQPNPAPAAPAATQPAQAAQTNQAPAAPAATQPAQAAQTNLWFVGNHPNPQPIAIAVTDAWGRQVNDALDNHRDGLNALRGEVDDINHHLGRQDGPNGPTYRPIGTISSTDTGVPVLGWIVALVVGLLVFLTSDWASQPWYSLLYAITWALATLAISWGINRLFAHFNNRS